MDVAWVEIPDFPNYLVSEMGEVMNVTTGRVIHQSMTPQGAAKVGLVRDKKQYTRSVRLLVAEAFIPGRTDTFDTPINLNGDPLDNASDNIAWRPRWFAWKHARQFNEFSDIHNKGPIYDTKTGFRYDDVYVAAVTNGLLLVDIWRSIHMKVPTFPTGQTFTFRR